MQIIENILIFTAHYWFSIAGVVTLIAAGYEHRKWKRQHSADMDLRMETARHASRQKMG